MKLLSIETSCDETALAVLDFHDEQEFSILSEVINSQIDIHKEYGGVYPAVAKREHAKNIYPLLFASLEESGLLVERAEEIVMETEIEARLRSLLDRDPQNLEHVLQLYSKYKNPDLRAIAVTYGPGLEIALWTGFNFARALSVIWDLDLVPVNHMEGHIYATLISHTKENSYSVLNPGYPNLSLLISGGHTELVLSKSEHQYKKIGQTLDDAIGEAYDKSARLIGIDYPGGPEISKLAEEFRNLNTEKKIELPRPMLHSKNYDFSFSGLKTAVLLLVQKQETITEKFKQELAYEFEEAASEVLLKKTRDAITEFGASSLIVSGGVSANTHLRREFHTLSKNQSIDLFLSDKKYTGDNAVMIGVAGHRRYIYKKHDPTIDRVKGNLLL